MPDVTRPMRQMRATSGTPQMRLVARDSGYWQATERQSKRRYRGQWIFGTVHLRTH
jgi:hypothetical protein